ncbi:Alpha/Beta hydrolase protein [Mycena galericulata]|nr:Alpha/Beta hydrolase protein [Mycena galericulata]
MHSPHTLDFEVTGPLPNVTGPLARSFAGNVGVNRPDHPNATLFFWAFEKANGTLTGAAKDTDPWIIWMNGGPGASSMLGMMTENGPLQVTGNYSIARNHFSWNNLADTFWIAEARQQWKRDLAGRPNGTLDPWYGCFIWDEMYDYALNFSFPWTFPLGGFDVYDIPDGLNPEVPSDPSVFLNGRAALHAPTSKDWVEDFNFPFGGFANGTDIQDPSLEQVHAHPKSRNSGSSQCRPTVFLSDLATNASARGNMTFGGVQGFTRTPFSDDNGNFAGIVHQERNLTYALFKGAGHYVPRYVPEAAFVFVREFVLGSNSTGLVRSNGTVVGGEVSALAMNVMPGPAAT